MAMGSCVQVGIYRRLTGYGQSAEDPRHYLSGLRDRCDVRDDWNQDDDGICHGGCFVSIDTNDMM